MSSEAPSARKMRPGRGTAPEGGEFGPPEAEAVVVGRDVLELVSSAMYVDPMTIYREYIQNAADAVDAARRDGLLGASEPGHVFIEIDPSARTARGHNWDHRAW